MSNQLANSKFSNVKLSDTQLVMMSAAAQREDRCLVAPQNLKGAAARKVAEKLVAAGLVREIKTVR
jgi:endonuclease YncB( thermonuclease family)